MEFIDWRQAGLVCTCLIIVVPAILVMGALVMSGRRERKVERDYDSS